MHEAIKDWELRADETLEENEAVMSELELAIKGLEERIHRLTEEGFVMGYAAHILGNSDES